MGLTKVGYRRPPSILQQSGGNLDGEYLHPNALPVTVAAGPFWIWGGVDHFCDGKRRIWRPRRTYDGDL